MRNDIMVRAIARRWALLLAAVVFLLVPAAANAQATKPLRLTVDLRRAPQGIIHSHIEIPVASGEVELAYPQWIQGTHAPEGRIGNVAGLVIKGGGRPLIWTRNPTDLYRFAVKVPPGVSSIEVDFDYLDVPSDGSGRREDTAANLAVLSWDKVLLYPVWGQPMTRAVSAALQLPTGWRVATALTVATETPGLIRFATTTVDRLTDSPVSSGEHLRIYPIATIDGVPYRLNVVANADAETVVPSAFVAKFARLVEEAHRLMPPPPFKSYDFIVTLSSAIRNNGLEHLSSTETRFPEGLFSDPDLMIVSGTWLTHELFHAWNGKYRRPAGVYAPDYQTPLQDELLWVYEGMTEYYGGILAARSGFWTPEQFRAQFAMVAAQSRDAPGWQWASIADSATIAPASMDWAWQSWNRKRDYYSDSALVWLDIDMRIRRMTNGRRSLDDFCRLFFAGTGDARDVRSYTLADVVRGLNEVAPFDWHGLIEGAVYRRGATAPLHGLGEGGWRLEQRTAPNAYIAASENRRRQLNLWWPVGMTLGNDGRVADILWDSPAAKAGLAPGDTVYSVNGRTYSAQAMRDAAETGNAIDVRFQRGGVLETARILPGGPHTYPGLTRVGGTPDSLTAAITPLSSGKP